MKFYFIVVVFFIALSTSLCVQSEETRQGTIGIGSYSLNVSNDLVEQDDELSGFGRSFALC